MKLLLIAALFLVSGIAVAQTPTVTRLCNNRQAFNDFQTASLDVSGDTHLSVEVDWAGLTGPFFDGVVALQVSNSAGATWTNKSGAINTTNTATGSVVFSLVNVTEQAYRINFAHNSITGGTINCYVLPKP